MGSILSERAERIGGWVALGLFAIWLMAGGWQRDAAAQGPPPPQQTQVLGRAPAQTVNQGSSTTPQSWWPADAPIIGGWGGALLAGLFAIFIAQRYTKQLKQIEATLEFSKRFHELIQQQCVLNRKYMEDQRDGKSLPESEEKDGQAWWWRFFDLLLYEYDFYQQGLVRKVRFEEWMIWRWYDSHRESGQEWRTCGIDYLSGWKNWKIHPAHGPRLIELLDQIHAIPDNADKKKVHEEVRQLVGEHGPGFGKTADLEKGRL
jgi:hypothetical protein